MIQSLMGPHIYIKGIYSPARQTDLGMTKDDSDQFEVLK